MRIMNNGRPFEEEVFGSAQRLRVLIWVASREGHVFSQREATQGSACAQGTVSRILDWLANRGLVLKAPRASVNQPLYYTRQDSVWWEVFKAARKAMDEPVVSSEGKRPVLEVQKG